MNCWCKRSLSSDTDTEKTAWVIGLESLEWSVHKQREAMARAAGKYMPVWIMKRTRSNGSEVFA